ncbi:tumor necrosis factor receptor family protein [Thalictrum thalictroides]|uniref:Tumor necrosis factor receptor family protein n=1 Tax=Thalictrum thalictroides TaxID=46969 RepID=A0A7J6UZ63_THATH|nr:tumor necrosis factor receptor family protein [Thalictrum thalictroides]
MFLRGGGGVGMMLVRHFSKKRAENVRKINPKVTPQEASSIAQNMYQVIKQNGPLTVSNTWNLLKDAGVSGLNSKTHMKLMLKWMRGRKMLKLFCNQVGSNKKFLHSTLPEEPSNGQSTNTLEVKLETEKPSMKKKKLSR